MQGSVVGDLIELNLSGTILRNKLRKNSDGLLIFKDGTLLENPDGSVLGGLIHNQRKYFLKGTIDQITITTLDYDDGVSIPPYRGFVIDKEIVRVRLYEPTVYSIPYSDVVAGWTKIKGIFYTIEMGHNDLLSLTPISQQSYHAPKI